MDNNENNQQTNENQYNGQQYNQPNYNQQYNQPNYNQQYNQQQFNPQYQAPMYQPPIEDTTPLSVGQWMLTMLVLGLPCVGLIMGFVWGFGDGNVNRKNYARAFLIWDAIAVGLYIIFIIIMFVLGYSLSEIGSSSYYYY